MSSLRAHWPRAACLLRLHDLRRGPSLTLYNSFLSALEGCGRWQRALDFLCSLPERKCRLDIATYNTALSACAAASSWEIAMALFHDLAPLRPDVITYNAVITACANAELWRKALVVMAEMKGIKANRISFNAVLHACAGRARGSTFSVQKCLLAISWSLGCLRCFSCQVPHGGNACWCYLAWSRHTWPLMLSLTPLASVLWGASAFRCASRDSAYFSLQPGKFQGGHSSGSMFWPGLTLRLAAQVAALQHCHLGDMRCSALKVWKAPSLFAANSASLQHRS